MAAEGNQEFIARRAVYYDTYFWYNMGNGDSKIFK